MKLNNLKSMLLIVSVFAVIATGLTVWAGVKGNHHTGEQKFAANEVISACPVGCDKLCCKDKDDTRKCPSDCDKPCCKKQNEKCPADCDKPCCKKLSLSCCGS